MMQLNENTSYGAALK